MPEYRRLFIAGGTYFFTFVTYKRQPIFNTSLARRLLRAAWLDVSRRFSFSTDAVCLLPDHLHCIITLPFDNFNYPMRLREIKRLLTRAYRSQKEDHFKKSTSRIKRSEATIWQRRYWEHTIRDEDDLYHHLNYIHYNPVKHDYVQKVSDWPWSSFHRFVKLGVYEKEWGEKIEDKFESQYGE
jgi:putative transposase